MTEPEARYEMHFKTDVDRFQNNVSLRYDNNNTLYSDIKL